MNKTASQRRGGFAAGFLMAAMCAATLGGMGVGQGSAPGGLLVEPAVGTAPGMAPGAADEAKVRVSVEVSRPVAAPGEQVIAAVVFDLSPHWHIWPNEPVLPPELEDVTPIPTRAVVTGEPGGISHVGPGQWPAPSMVEVNYGTRPVGVASFEGRVIGYVPLIVAEDAPEGVIEVPIRVSYQACDDSICLQPMTETLTARIEVRRGGAPASAPDEAVFGGFDPSVFAKMLAGEASADGAGPASEFDFLGLKFSVATNSYAIILGIAFVAGFLLNLTPCVLPVIPLKVLSLQKQASNPGKLAYFGTIYCLGIVATFVALGLLILGVRVGAETQDWGQIFSSKWFALAMAGIVGVMGLGMMGLFTISLPKAVYMVNPAGDTAQGNFMMGVLTAILSTPCTGPFLGATIVWAATQPRWVGMSTFVVMGLGMAFPYALLILFPKLIAKMPRSGPGGELLKQVLGIVLLSVAAFLASNVTSEKWPWYVVGGLAGAAFLWTIVGGWRMLRTRGAKWAVTGIGALGLAGSALATRAMTEEGPVPWVSYSPEAFEAARSDGKVVVLKFTAKWCTNCHVIEKTILNAEPARGLLNERRVVPMKVDLTSETNVAGWEKLREVSGGSGIPLTAVYRPGEEGPVIFRSFYTGSALVEAVGAGPG